MEAGNYFPSNGFMMRMVSPIAPLKKQKDQKEKKI
jgi:hypothetical protein